MTVANLRSRVPTPFSQSSQPHCKVCARIPEAPEHYASPGSHDGKWPGCVCRSLLGTAWPLEGPVRPLPCYPEPEGQQPRSLTRPGQACRASPAPSLQGPRELLLGCLACGPGLALHSPPPSPPETWRLEPPAESRTEPEDSASWPLGLPQAPPIQRSSASVGSACPALCLSLPQLWSPHPARPGSQVFIQRSARCPCLHPPQWGARAARVPALPEALPALSPPELPATVDTLRHSLLPHSPPSSWACEPPPGALNLLPGSPSTLR